MKATLHLAGLRELKVNLDQMKKSTARGVLERALRKAAKPVETDAKSMAPELTGELKRSIKTTVIRSNAGKSAFAAAMRDGGSRADANAAARDANRVAAGRGATATVRVAATAPYAHFVEFGSLRQGATPFMGPAFRKNQKNITANIKDELGAEIKKTAARLAKRKV